MDIRCIDVAQRHLGEGLQEKLTTKKGSVEAIKGKLHLLRSVMYCISAYAMAGRLTEKRNFCAAPESFCFSGSEIRAATALRGDLAVRAGAAARLI